MVTPWRHIGRHNPPDMGVAITLVVKTGAAPEGLPLMVKSIAASIDPKLFPYIRLLKADFHKNVQQVEQAAMVVSLLG